MDNIVQAADAVKSVARTFQAVIDMANLLETIASVEQAEGHARGRLKDLQDQIDSAQAFQEAISAKSEKLKVELEKGSAEYVAFADSTVARAALDAQALIDDAKQQAATVVADARAAVQRCQLDAETAEQRTATAAQELADINAKLERARAKMAEILGS